MPAGSHTALLLGNDSHTKYDQKGAGLNKKLCVCTHACVCVCEVNLCMEPQ